MILKMFSICSYFRLKYLKFLKCLPTCLGFADKLPFIHELHSKVKEINLTIEKIMANRSKYSLEALVTFSLSSTNHGVSNHQERRNANVEEVGMEEIKEGIGGGEVDADQRRSNVEKDGFHSGNRRLGQDNPC